MLYQQPGQWISMMSSNNALAIILAITDATLYSLGNKQLNDSATAIHTVQVLPSTNLSHHVSNFSSTPSKTFLYIMLKYGVNKVLRDMTLQFPTFFFGDILCPNFSTVSHT